MKFILGRKLKMSQIYTPDGKVVPVTLVEAGPCTVTQVKNEKRDGYKAVQIGFGKKKNLKRPIAGHLKELGENFRYLKEFRIKEEEIKRGDKINVSTFTPGDTVAVTASPKGRGFQGVVKRHGFHGHPASHGHKDQLRMPGSIGSKRIGPVAKGKRMAGRMGGEQVTVKNLEIVSVDAEKNILAIKGALPGATHNLILIKGEGELKLAIPIAAENKEEIKSETTIAEQAPILPAENTPREEKIEVTKEK